MIAAPPVQIAFGHVAGGAAMVDPVQLSDEPPLVRAVQEAGDQAWVGQVIALKTIACKCATKVWRG